MNHKINAHEEKSVHEISSHGAAQKFRYLNVPVFLTSETPAQKPTDKPSQKSP